jgi:NadR type nicotinamide-nucleotide adenylyltransferase
MKLRSICLHGPESTGKSTMAPELARHFGSTCVVEYGRTYTEAFGTDWTMADLVAIGQAHDAQTRQAIASGRTPVILDTDPLMTEVWAEMLFGRHDPWFDSWNGFADLYLLFDIDLPWVEDGTRMFGTPDKRKRFYDLSMEVLERRGVRWTMVSGEGEQRYLTALRAILGTEKSLSGA